MNILLIGGGGREHALAWKLSQSPACTRLYVAPGNAGTSQYGANLPLDPNDFSALGAAVRDRAIELVVVGPEEPLVRGVYDYFRAEADLADVKVIGPSRDAAQLEGSKAFAKAFMQRYRIPTAAYREFTAATAEEGLAYIDRQPTPIVLKADGLAAGKGVLICETAEEARREFAAMLEGKFDAAGRKVVVEQFLRGIEFSVFILTDGRDYVLLPVAKDYKRIGEGDTGLNTGGMGCVSPPPFVDEALMAKVKERIILPTLHGIQQEKLTYRGFLFFGLMNVAGDPYVIEYNCRLGDPETEVILPRLRNDLVELLVATDEGRLAGLTADTDPRAAAAVILVSGGYPGAYEKGKTVTGLEAADGSLLFHAGTRAEGGQVLTNGGRVIALTSFGDDFRDALRLSYQNAEVIDFAGKYYRKDIGFDL